MGMIHNRLSAKAVEQRIPISGSFELLPLCNFTCKMCYVREDRISVQKAGGLKPASWWLERAHQAADAGWLFPLLTGGEPFLYPDFPKLADGMSRIGLQISINTNGSLIDEEAVSWLKTCVPARINITLYGASRETYCRLCGSGRAFDQVVHAADLLTEAGIRFRFNCSLTPDNACDLDGMLKLAAGYGKGLRLSTYMLPPIRRTGKSGDFDARFSPEQAAYYEALLNFRQSTPEKFRRLAHNAAMYREPSEEQLLAAENGPAGEMRCLSGRCSFWVDWQGNLSNCGVNDYPKVSLDEYDFAEAWQKIVDHTNTFRFSPPCTNCINKGVCFSCAAAVYNETGSFDGRPVYLCEKAKYAAKWYQYFLKQLPEEDEPASSGKPAGGSVPECPVDEF